MGVCGWKLYGVAGVSGRGRRADEAQEVRGCRRRDRGSSVHVIWIQKVEDFCEN